MAKRSPRPIETPDSWTLLRGPGVWRAPLPEIPRAGDRLLLRLAAAVTGAQLREVTGLARILPESDPFVLVANHGAKRDAVILPTLLMLARGGRPVHFLADWNFRLIPGVGYLYDKTGAINVLRKPARPALLNRLKERYLGAPPPFAQARERLAAGAPVALFPEGTVNRSAEGLLRFRPGAVRLALAAGVPVIPVGIRLHRRRRDGRSLDSWGPISVHVGLPIRLNADADAGPAEIARLGAGIAAEVARLSGKDQWGRAPRPGPPFQCPSLTSEDGGSRC